jgi:hypothetical protein
MTLIPITSSSDSAVVGATAAILTGMVVGKQYFFASSTNCWIKQGSTTLVTCVAKASFADTDFFTLTIDGVSTVYEFDTAGNGVTAGRVQVNISTDTTAANCAARLRTAILASQPALTVTDNTDGTLTVSIFGGPVLTFSENVANAGFTVATVSPPATAADGSMYVPANTLITLTGDMGPTVGVVQDSVAGKASLTRVEKVL